MGVGVVLGAGQSWDVDMAGKAAPPARDLGQVNGKAGFQERLSKRQGWPLNGFLDRRGIQGRKKGQPRLRGRPSSARRRIEKRLSLPRNCTQR